MLRAVNEHIESAREIALRARADAALAEAEAARVSCARLAREAHAALERARKLEVQLGHIARHARRAAARTRDEFALAALGDIAITAEPAGRVVAFRR